jgi:hypothetical protein
MVPAPAEVDDHAITSSGVSSNLDGSPHRISVFLWSGKIYALMSRILQLLYIPVDITGVESSESEENGIMMKLEDELRQIRTDLPPHLSLEEPVAPAVGMDVHDWRLRHRIIIRNRYACQRQMARHLGSDILLRYYRTRILLFRPSLIRALRARASGDLNAVAKEETFTNASNLAAQRICLATACAQIDLCHSTTATQFDAPWYRRFCEFKEGSTKHVSGLIDNSRYV